MAADLCPTLVMRLTSQHRAIYCYLLLSAWIFVLLGGMYKYIGSEDGSGSLVRHSTGDFTTRSFSQSIRPDIKARRVMKVCNPPNMITAGSEGRVKGNYTLEGVLVLIRHGDRGPLTHVRNISSIDCSCSGAPELVSYEAFVDNLTGTAMQYQLLGPFHGFPLLPAAECALGQLTRVGVAQLLATGRLLRRAYAERLGLTNVTVAAYSTRYRRTLQSALALLYALLTPQGLHGVTLKESQSMSFCFDDCACPAADIHNKKFVSELSGRLKSHPAVAKLVRSSASVVYEMTDKHLSSDPYALKDALLTYVCHNARLPCSDLYSPSDVCVRTEHVTGLFAYIEWETRQHPKSASLKRVCLLRAYGLLKNIVVNMLRIMSEKKPKIVVYSGHDKTILYLATALGIVSDTTSSPHYASRFVIEVYRNNDSSTMSESGPMGSDYYFRAVYNGKDLTQRIHFCRSTSASDSPAPSESAQKKPALCPVESIIRFLHDDYFSSFNVTNLKDACIIHD
ncbi:2-phosphoxylose phosphatase 1 [Nilaparvata lugens]|uniref:2-phosphoxylose phosphatase 1 n=1 Tax=Nilaparvata lugens TaxID=108931 RepID=UPI00193CDF04|nr:2-phosphoxylose phosphatase 1 [Nilaparvata lugens]